MHALSTADDRNACLFGYAFGEPRENQSQLVAYVVRQPSKHALNHASCELGEVRTMY